MSVLNKTLKSIEQRDSSAELGLEPTVELKQQRQIPKSILVMAVFIVACITVVAAYMLIPQRQQSSASAPVSPVIAQVTKQQQNTTNEQQGEAFTPKTPMKAPQQALQRVPTEQSAAPEPAARLEATAKQLEAVHLQEPEAVTNTPSEPIATDEQSKPKIAVTTAVAPQAPVAPKVTDSGETTVLVKPLNEAQRAQRWFQQGQQSLSYSMMDEAISQFEQALTLAPEHNGARSLLAATLYGQQRVDEAYSVLVAGLQRQPEVLDWRILIAKMATEQQQYARVLAALSGQYDQQANQIANNDYWILKGSAARKLQRFDIAKTSFTVLIKRQPNVAKWWLALAISEDELGEFNAAKSHYATALQLGGLSVQSQRFARARYEQL